MKLEFKPDDFDNLFSCEGMAIRANSRLAEMLKDAPVVYKFEGLWDEHCSPVDKYKAFLVNIEELKPKECEHEPLTFGSVVSHALEYRCKQCGKPLKAKWQVADE